MTEKHAAQGDRLPVIDHQGGPCRTGPWDLRLPPSGPFTWIAEGFHRRKSRFHGQRDPSSGIDERGNAQDSSDLVTLGIGSEVPAPPAR